MRLLVSSVCAGLLALPGTLHAQSTQSATPNSQGAGMQTTVMPVTEFHPHETTTLPEAARYEIMQSSFAAKVTLRLDRWSGAVDQMVSRADSSSIGWQAVQREIKSGSRSAAPGPGELPDFFVRDRDHLHVPDQLEHGRDPGN